MHPIRSRQQRLLDVRRAGREDAPAHVPSRLVLPALLPGLRTGQGTSGNAKFRTIGNSAEGRGRTAARQASGAGCHAVEGCRMGTARGRSLVSRPRATRSAPSVDTATPQLVQVEVPRSGQFRADPTVVRERERYGVSRDLCTDPPHLTPPRDPQAAYPITCSRDRTGTACLYLQSSKSPRHDG